MSSFFSFPKKRKRDDQSANTTPASRSARPNRLPTSTRSKPGSNSKKPPLQAKRSRKEQDDSEISSESEDERGRAGAAEEELPEEGDDIEGETAEQKRIRLASQYLSSQQALREEDLGDDGFDAADLDAEIIKERLEASAAENAIKSSTSATRVWVKRQIADQLQVEQAEAVFFGTDSKFGTVGVATHWPYVYTLSQDGRLVKWKVPRSPFAESSGRRKKPYQKLFANIRASGNSGHGGHVTCLALSPDGTVLATGGQDRKIILWQASNLKYLRTFAHHRSPVMNLSFRTDHQLFSASSDRSVKVWSTDPDAMGYIETLFGHADSVVSVAALPGDREMCVSVGGRDRTARVWKVVEEEQLVFRAGSSRNERRDNSIDCVAAIDGSNFVIGGDAGGLQVFNLGKKKAVFTMGGMHGVDKEIGISSALPDLLEEANTDKENGFHIEAPPNGTNGNPKKDNAHVNRWITALGTIEMADVVVSGSWDGSLLVAKVGEDKGKKNLQPLGRVGPTEKKPDDYMDVDGGRVEGAEKRAIKGIVNAIALTEVPAPSKSGEEDEEDEDDDDEDEANAKAPTGLLIVAGVSKTHKLGRWYDLSASKMRHKSTDLSPGPGVPGKNGAYLVWIPYSTAS
jgi:ribosomal RNA-processing protein 9